MKKKIDIKSTNNPLLQKKKGEIPYSYPFFNYSLVINQIS